MVATIQNLSLAAVIVIVVIVAVAVAVIVVVSIKVILPFVLTFILFIFQRDIANNCQTMPYRVKFICKDGQFNVNHNVALLMGSVRNLLFEKTISKQMPRFLVKNLELKVVKIVADWCKSYNINSSLMSNDANISDIRVTDWERDLLAVDKDTFFKIIEAAHLLKIKILIKTCSKILTENIEDKSLLEIKQYFNVDKALSQVP